MIVTYSGSAFVVSRFTEPDKLMANDILTTNVHLSLLYSLVNFVVISRWTLTPQLLPLALPPIS